MPCRVVPGFRPLSISRGPQHAGSAVPPNDRNLPGQGCGAGEGIRTPDLLITSELLYRLSYPGKGIDSIQIG